MSTGERDCRHLCCDERDNPFHDHFLPPSLCPRCEREREAVIGSLPHVPHTYDHETQRWVPTEETNP